MLKRRFPSKKKYYYSANRLPRAPKVKTRKQWLHQRKSKRLIKKNLFLVSKFFIKSGNQSSANSILREFLFFLKKRFNDPPSKTIVKTIFKLKPNIHLRLVNKSGVNYRIPALFSAERQPTSISLRWLKQSAKDRFEYASISQKLYLEVCDILKNRGKALARRFNWHSAAIDNRALTRFRFNKRRYRPSFFKYPSNLTIYYNKFSNTKNLKKFLAKLKARDAFVEHLRLLNNARVWLTKLEQRGLLHISKLFKKRLRDLKVRYMYGTYSKVQASQRFKFSKNVYNDASWLFSRYKAPKKLLFLNVFKKSNFKKLKLKLKTLKPFEYFRKINFLKSVNDGYLAKPFSKALACKGFRKGFSNIKTFWYKKTVTVKNEGLSDQQQGTEKEEEEELKLVQYYKFTHSKYLIERERLKHVFIKVKEKWKKYILKQLKLRKSGRWLWAYSQKDRKYLKNYKVRNKWWRDPEGRLRTFEFKFDKAGNYLYNIMLQDYAHMRSLASSFTFKFKKLRIYTSYIIDLQKQQKRKNVLMLGSLFRLKQEVPKKIEGKKHNERAALLYFKKIVRYAFLKKKTVLYQYKSPLPWSVMTQYVRKLLIQETQNINTVSLTSLTQDIKNKNLNLKSKKFKFLLQKNLGLSRFIVYRWFLLIKRKRRLNLSFKFIDAKRTKFIKCLLETPRTRENFLKLFFKRFYGIFKQILLSKKYKKRDKKIVLKNRFHSAFISIPFDFGIINIFKKSKDILDTFCTFFLNEISKRKSLINSYLPLWAKKKVYFKPWYAKSKRRIQIFTPVLGFKWSPTKIKNNNSRFKPRLKKYHKKDSHKNLKKRENKSVRNAYTNREKEARVKKMTSKKLTKTTTNHIKNKKISLKV